MKDISMFLRSKTSRVFAIALTFAAISVESNAAFLDSPVPASAYITKSGLDWAWANPVQGADLTYQAGQGWRIPTSAELAVAPLATDFLKADGNVPFNGTDPVSGANFQVTNAAYTGPAACAAPYFSTSYRHCDWTDGNGQPSGPWYGLPDGSNEQLVVRGTLVAAAPAVPVPTLSQWGLLLLSSLIGMAALRFRRYRA